MVVTDQKVYNRDVYQQNYTDTGCQYNPACLTCPFPSCYQDESISTQYTLGLLRFCHLYSTQNNIPFKHVVLALGLSYSPISHSLALYRQRIYSPDTNTYVLALPYLQAQIRGRVKSHAGHLRFNVSEVLEDIDSDTDLPLEDTHGSRNL